MSTDPREITNKRCGEILGLAVNVEEHLDLFLSHYFCGYNQKSNLIQDEIFQNLNLDRKIKIFEKVCKFEKFDQKKLKQTINDIRFIQKIRNKIAHDETQFESPPGKPEEGEIRFWSRKHTKYRKDSLVLTEELMDKMYNRFNSMYNGIIDAYKQIIMPQNQSSSNLDNFWDNNSEK